MILDLRQVSALKRYKNYPVDPSNSEWTVNGNIAHTHTHLNSQQDTLLSSRLWSTYFWCSGFHASGYYLAHLLRGQANQQLDETHYIVVIWRWWPPATSDNRTGAPPKSSRYVCTGTVQCLRWPLTVPIPSGPLLKMIRRSIKQTPDVRIMGHAFQKLKLLKIARVNAENQS